MATIALPVIVAALLPKGVTLTALSTAILTTAGSLFDQSVLFPALFGSGETGVDMPRINDIDFQSASEGSPIHRFYGPEPRSKGTVIWMSDLIEEKTRQKVSDGGIFSKAERVDVFTYFVDIAVAFGHGPLESIDRIRADSKIIWERFDDGDGENVLKVVSDQISAEEKGGFFDRESVYRSPVGGPDLSVFKVGQDITVSGFTDDSFNGTDRCNASGTDDDGSTWLVVDISPDYNDQEAAGNTITITQTLNKISAEGPEEVTIYLGTDSQTADPLIESYEGAGNVPGHRGIAYVVLKRLPLGPFGNRIPQIDIEGTAHTTITVGAVIEDQLDLLGFDASMRDASEVTDALKGMQLSGPQNVLQVIRSLLLAYDVVGQEIGGQIRFRKRSDLDEITIPANHLSAHVVGSEDRAERPVRIETPGVLRLPDEVSVSFRDEGNDNQKGNVPERKAKALDGDSRIATMDLPVVMNADEAQEVAARVLWSAWANRRRAFLALPPSYLHVTENDVLVVPAFDQSLKILVKRVDRGNNLLNLIEGVVVDVDSFTQVSSGGSVITVQGDSSDPIRSPGRVITEFIDIAPFHSEHVDRIGYYWAAALEYQADGWRGAILFTATTVPLQSAAWAWLADISEQATIGFAVSTIGEGPVHYWDRVNTVDIQMYHGELESKSEDEVLNGANWAVLRDEVIAFQDATYLGNNVYRLSTLLRGLRNTEDQVTEHDHDPPTFDPIKRERFVLIYGDGVAFQGEIASRVGKRRYFRAVPSGRSLDETGADVHLVESNTLRPFSPTQAEAERDGSDNITLTWIARTRELYDPFSMLPTPPALEGLHFEIDVMDGSTVVRTISVSGTTTASYTAAEQTTDGLTPGDPVTFRFYQVNKSWTLLPARSKPLEETL